MRDQATTGRVNWAAGIKCVERVFITLIPVKVYSAMNNLMNVHGEFIWLCESSKCCFFAAVIWNICSRETRRLGKKEGGR